ncbi:MFS transporter [Kibdelosporangium lantanae]
MSVVAMTHARFTPRQRAVLLVLLGAGFMLSVDFSILNVALPEIGAGVSLDVASLPWITTAFVLPAAGFTLVFGRIADLFGRRRVFLAGMWLLVVASILGGIATSPGLLLAARALQGFAAAMVTPASLSLLTTTFTEGNGRERVLGLNGALACGGFTVGALVGGTLVDLLSWRAAFFVNVPVAAVILVVTPYLITESTRPERVRLDLPGAVTVSGGLLAIVYAVIERSVFAAVVGGALVVAFWAVERRSPAPLVSPRVLARPSVRWGNFAGLVIFAMETAMIFIVTLYLQRTLGLTPLTAGLVFGVPGLASVAAGVVAGRVIGRVGARRVLVTGLAVQPVATAPLLLIGTDPASLWIVVPALFVSFFAHVSAIVAFMVTATSGLPDGEQGLATGLASMTQQIGITVGTPVLSAIAATQAVELTGIHLALGVEVAVTLVAVIVLAGRMRGRASR